MPPEWRSPAQVCRGKQETGPFEALARREGSERMRESSGKPGRGKPKLSAMGMEES